MTNKLLSQLTFLVALGLLIIFGRNALTRYQQQQPNEYLKAIKDIKADDLVRLELSKDEQMVVFTKQDGKWKIASKSADLAKVNELVSALLPKQSPQLISENNEKFSDLELTEELEVRVKLISQQKENIFNVGKQIGVNTAVVMQGLEKVYGLASMPILSVKSEDWIDKTVVDIDSLQVKQLIFTGKDKFTFNQTADRVWAFEGEDQKVNSDGVSTFMYKFNPFKADNLATEDLKKQFDLLSSGFGITLVDKSDNKTELMFKLVKDQYVVKRTSDGEYFIISKTAGEAFAKTKDSFKASE